MAIAKKGGLNRGLEALLPDILGIAGGVGAKKILPTKSALLTEAESRKSSVQTEPKSSRILVQAEVAARQDAKLHFWDVTQLEPSRFQPRREILDTELESLADSIKSQGILQPLVIRAMPGGGKGEIIAGERRWRAATLAGLTEVPVIVKDLTDQECMAVALIENVQRENLNPIDEAIAIERLVNEFDLTHAQIAALLGKSRAVITNLLRLLTLPQEVRLLLENQDLEVGHAKVLLGLPTSAQAAAARNVIAKNLSVRETESLVSRILTNTEGAKKTATIKKLDPDIKRLQESLAATVGSQVEILHGKSGQGKIVIHYNNLDELDGILAHIR